MADKKDQEGISQVTFFSVVVQIFVSMSVLLGAVGRPEDSWYRVFVQCYLTLMTVLYAGGMVWLLWRRKANRKGRAVEGDPGAQA